MGSSWSVRQFFDSIIVVTRRNAPAKAPRHFLGVRAMLEQVRGRPWAEGKPAKSIPPDEIKAAKINRRQFAMPVRSHDSETGDLAIPMSCFAHLFSNAPSASCARRLQSDVFGHESRIDKRTRMVIRY
jgi:hypothetical protein